MVVTVTEGKYDAQRLIETEAFLAGFLPRMRKEPGVVEIVHFADAKGGTTSTVVMWESEADVRRYREGELINEAIAFEQQAGGTARRAGPFPGQRYG